MSRSYRRGFQCAGDKELKKLFNRKLRRSQLKGTEDLPVGNGYKKMNESWDIADYKDEIVKEDYDNWADFQRYRSK